MVTFLFCVTGCSSVKKAEKFVEEGKYQEAIAILADDTSEDAQTALATYVVEYANILADKGEYKEAVVVLSEYDSEKTNEYASLYVDELMSSEKYQDAKDILLLLEDGSYDKMTLTRCNIGIVRKGLNAVGKRGDEGNRVYVNYGDAIIYLENSSENTIIMGYTMTNAVGGNSFKLYIDGSDTPYFEAEQVISFTLFGRVVSTTTTGFGTVDISADSGKFTLNADSVVNQGGVNASGNTVADVVDSDTFIRIFNDILSDVLKNMPSLLEKSESGITLIDLGFNIA